MTLGDQLIFGGFAIAGVAFPVVLFFYVRLKRYVSREKVHAVEDVSQLWEHDAPPKIVLNDKGLRLRRYTNVSTVILLTTAGMIGVVSIFDISSRQNVLSAIMVGSVLAIAIFESRLKHQISKEKVHAVEDVSRLWVIAAPPATVLNEKGLCLYRYMLMSATVFFIGMGIVFSAQYSAVTCRSGGVRILDSP